MLQVQTQAVSFQEKNPLYTSLTLFELEEGVKGPNECET